MLAFVTNPCLQWKCGYQIINQSSAISIYFHQLSSFITVFNFDFLGLGVGDPVSVSAEQAGQAKGRRVVVELQETGVSVIAEYVLPREYDAFMRNLVWVVLPNW